ncbi:BTAD domain-containing putative transcriptional regulator [Streptomyces sp. ISL-86]|uniref:BTAD domain-containing putative transcriptional regulator n=1 Tax=Streptomyces sp. ISL-86 TaxID=2819187 RepID=UPI00203558F4|nr:BTAD domain-containing putative transcriptional regulator [Streptomyces sp. ISL-86]
MTVSPGGVPHTPDTVVFRILGPLQVTGQGGPVRIPPGRQEVILAALLLEANRVVSTDYLVDLIWDDEPPDTARTQVQICVSRLRKLFTKAEIAAAITTRPPGYVLKTEGDLVDAAVFSRRVTDARVVGKQGDLAEAAELLRAAGELWQGDCLSGVSSETLRSKALQLDEERLTAAEARIDLELDLGRHHQLVGEIQLLVRVHPLRERLRGQLMLALYRSGRQAEALESYRVGRELMIEELGLEPGGELRRLESAILSGDVPSGGRGGGYDGPSGGTYAGRPVPSGETGAGYDGPSRGTYAGRPGGRFIARPGGAFPPGGAGPDHPRGPADGGLFPGPAAPGYVGPPGGAFTGAPTGTFTGTGSAGGHMPDGGYTGPGSAGGDAPGSSYPRPGAAGTHPDGGYTGPGSVSGHAPGGGYPGPGAAGAHPGGHTANGANVGGGSGGGQGSGGGYTGGHPGVPVWDGGPLPGQGDRPRSGTADGGASRDGGPAWAGGPHAGQGAGAQDPAAGGGARRDGAPAWVGGAQVGQGGGGGHFPVQPGQGAARAAEGYREEIPRQLPADTSDFVGDEARITGIERTLLGEGGRRAVGLAVIVGKPGTGKSTLATHIAHRLSETAFPDGQLYCDLRGTGTPATSAEVLGRFLRALGIPGPVIPESQDERAEMYRTLLASRRVLVVLDDAASESQIRPLLPGSNTCAVLVTSRVRLTGLPGAHRVELDVMGTGHALELLARVIGADRIEREGVAAEALVRTVGGLPLALRIVAARLAARPHWTLASMVHRLANERHRLDELTHGEMTMRASLSLTHDGLAPEDRRLLRLLSLAQGPTLPGWLAGALLDDQRPFPSDLLEPLVDVQMLDVVGVESTGGFRYRFHEIIRVFAREQLAAHDEPAAQSAALGRMMGGWLSLAEQAHRRIYGGDFTVLHGTAPRWQPPAACVDELLVDPLEWLDSEHANLVQAVEHAARERMDELCWDLATTLATLFEGRGYFDDWERTHQLALDCVRSAGNTRGTAALLSSLGVLYLGRSQHDESRSALSSALALFQELGDRQGLALCHRDLALLERMRGSEDQALVLYDRALRDFDEVGDVVGRAIVLTQSAHIWMRRGQTSVAQSRLDEALGIYRSVGYTGGQARTLRRAGQLQQGQGEHERAVQTFTEVLELCRDSGDIIGEGHLLRDLGHAHAEMGRGEAARGFYAQALSVREQIMDQGGAALVRLDLARLLAASGGSGERSRSRELLETAVRAFRDRRMEPELAEAERMLGARLPEAREASRPEARDMSRPDAAVRAPGAETAAGV